MTVIARRTILAGLASLGVASLARTGHAAAATLKAAAQARGLIWGAAVQQTQLRDDAQRVLQASYPNSSLLSTGFKAKDNPWWKFW